MDPLHGNWYAFWSGIANDVPIYILGFLPFILSWYKKNKCHYPKCHRLGHFPLAHYKLCHKHHPGVKKDIPLHIAQIHKEKQNGSTNN